MLAIYFGPALLPIQNYIENASQNASENLPTPIGRHFSRHWDTTATSADDPQTSLQSYITGKRWQLVNNKNITIQFLGEGRLTGSGGCNIYFGSYRLVGDRLNVGTVGSTMKACNEAVMAQEMQFLQNLSTVNRLRRAGELLIMEGNAPESSLTFRR